MDLTVHNVGHGLCISLIHQNGNVMLWDCGHQEYYRPSSFLPELGVSKVDYFFVTNYDEDHISDLPDLRDNLQLRSMYRNKSISADQLRVLKRETGPISAAMGVMLDMISNYTGGPLTPSPEFPGVNFRTFSNPYNDEFNDTNNISLVTFLECGDTKFIIPGDVEKKAWKALLKKQDFINELSGVDVFIASHHGREDGYCGEVFNYCTPDVIIFSDSNIQHATQEMADTYSRHANGIRFNGSTRYILSTRNDGTFKWTI